MKVIGKCIYSTYNFVLDRITELDINEEEETFKIVPNRSDESGINDYPLSKLDIYFKLYKNRDDIKNILKDNLGITDDDILEYKENGDPVLCIRYKHDFIYFEFVDYEYEYPIYSEVKITSNNLARQKTLEIELFKDDIIELCKLIKFLQK